MLVRLLNVATLIAGLLLVSLPGLRSAQALFVISGMTFLTTTEGVFRHFRNGWLDQPISGMPEAIARSRLRQADLLLRTLALVLGVTAIVLCIGSA